jgi:hypothetical protein
MKMIGDESAETGKEVFFERGFSVGIFSQGIFCIL